MGLSVLRRTVVACSWMLQTLHTACRELLTVSTIVQQIIFRSVGADEGQTPICLVEVSCRLGSESTSGDDVRKRKAPLSAECVCCLSVSLVSRTLTISTNLESLFDQL